MITRDRESGSWSCDECGPLGHDVERRAALHLRDEHPELAAKLAGAQIIRLTRRQRRSLDRGHVPAELES